MSSPNQSILFVSHQASRSGAPVLLLSIIKEIKKQGNIPFRILLAEEGDLSADFRSLGETFIWKTKELKEPGTFTSKILYRLSAIHTRIRRRFILFRVRKTSIVFLNTITNGHIQEKLSVFKPRFICYVHELEMAIRQATTPRSLTTALTKTDIFLTGSRAVKDNLVDNHQINERSIKILYYPMSLVLHKKSSYTQAVSSFRLKNGVPADAVTIGVAASSEWRKGFDLFPALVKIYFDLFPNGKAYFVWMGIKETGSFNPNLTDFKKYSLDRRTILVPHGSDYFNHMACFDIHLLLSREDPYPLVVLDAAAFSIPTVCFQNSGGTPEFVEPDAGLCVPYGDLIKMAQNLEHLVINKDLRTKMGCAAREKVFRKHDFQTQTNEIVNLLKQTI